MGWRMRTNPNNVLWVTQTTPHKSQDHSRWSTQTDSRHTHAAGLQGRKSQPERTCYNLVNEQAQSQPHRIHARHQGTQSPQISVTFHHFNSVPFIWCRGPRPKAHWYMHADGTNYRNHHNYSPHRRVMSSSL